MGGQTNLIYWALTICDLTSRNQWIVTTALIIIKEIQWTRSYSIRVWWSYWAERHPGSFWLSRNLGTRSHVSNHTPVSQAVHTVTMNNKTVKSTLLNQEKMFVALLAEMGNPYMKISADVLFIDTRAIIDATVAATVGTIKVLSKDRYGKFWHKCCCSVQNISHKHST